MKTLLLALSLACFGSLFAQGKYVGAEFKALIGESYSEKNELGPLIGFTSRGGSIITNPNDPEKFAGTWFSKGSTAIVLFETIDDDNVREILDVLEIKKFDPQQEIMIGACRYGKSEMPGLVALVKSGNDKRLKPIKVWNLNRDKVRIEVFAPEKVTCIGMEGDD
jgi:hypothetical protein